MADELNVPTHRWYEPRNNISLPKTDFSAQTIYDSGIQKIDAWINSQPWGNPVPGLFALAEPGVWYDPSDLTTLFQDTAGTTPVTTPGQTVALALDKSKGLTLGPELVTNGDFSNGTTGWTAGGTTNQSVVDGYLRVVAGEIFGSYRTVTTTAGRWYEVRGQIAMISGGTNVRVRVESGTTPGSSPIASSLAITSTTPTDVVFRFLATATSHAIYLRVETTGSVGRFDNISAKELPGFHATQATAASRPTYQVDGNGKAYLSFDGVDDFLVTPTITPGTDKAQVFAGVRKLSDAATGILVELGTATGNGWFNLAAPAATGAQKYYFGSNGTVLSNANTTSTAYNAPTTNVLTGLGDISGDLATLRVNGTQAAQSTADQGTGNFLAYPLYIGRRGGTTLPFNGNIFSLVVRFGANLEANTITNTERWVGGKTGVTI